MSNYTVTTNFGAKDALSSGNPAKLILGAQLTTEFNNIATALATKFDGVGQFAPDGSAAQPSFGFQSIAGTGMLNSAGILEFATGSAVRATIATNGLFSALQGLTVAGAAFTSRGITDNATATALTIASGGGLSVAAPSSGNALNLTGTTNVMTLLITGSSSSGLSQGLQINAGTTSADRALLVQNQNGATAFLSIFGDGGMTIGAPTGGDLGGGGLNAQSYLAIGGAYVYAGVPVNVQSGATYTTVASDSGKQIYNATTVCAYTINDAVMPTNTVITFVNRAGAGATIALSSGTMFWSPSGTTGTRTLSNYAVVTVTKVASGVYFLTGTGVT
jgi:hypothetical protein